MELNHIFLSLRAPGSTYPLEAALKNGGGRDHPTVATLSVTPAREDDGAVFRCVVWNRAMPEGAKLETTVTLNVNCKYSNPPSGKISKNFQNLLVPSNPAAESDRLRKTKQTKFQPAENKSNNPLPEKLIINS